jgi:hypothetical protein
MVATRGGYRPGQRASEVNMAQGVTQMSLGQSICCGISAFLLVAIPLTLWGRFIFFPYIGARAVGIRFGWNVYFVDGKPFRQGSSRSTPAFIGLRLPLAWPWMVSVSSAESGPTSPGEMAVAELVVALLFALSAVSTWVLHKVDPVLVGLLVGLPLSIYALHGAAQGVVVVYRSLRASSSETAPTSTSTPASGRAVASHVDANACQQPEPATGPGIPPGLDEGPVTAPIDPTAHSSQSSHAAPADKVEQRKVEDGYVLGDDPLEYLGDRAVDNVPSLLVAVYHVALGIALFSVLVIALFDWHRAIYLGHSLRLYTGALAYGAGVVLAIKRFFSGELRLWHIYLYLLAVEILGSKGFIPTPVELWRTLTGS